MLINLSKRRSAHAHELVDLLAECHQRIRRFTALAREAAVRWDAPDVHVVQACVDVERYFRVALPLHVADEEQSIEPRLRGLSRSVDRALRTMAEQHQAHAVVIGALLEALVQVERDPQSKQGRAALAEAATELEHDFIEHLQLEESVIFPAIREHLSAETQAQIIGELRQRRRLDAPEEQEHLR